MEAAEDKNVCKIRTCSNEKYKETDYCILHLPTGDKDHYEFARALESHISEKGNEFLAIHFPDRIAVEGDVENITSFTICHFYGEVNFQNCNIKSRYYLRSCHFHAPLRLSKSQFEKEVTIIGCTFNSAAYFNEAKFQESTFLYSNNFKQGANFYGVDYGPNFVLQECKLGYSFFYLSDISKIKLDSCKWNRSYVLAEEQYALRFFVDEVHLALPDNYPNRALLWITKALKRAHVSPRLLVKQIFNNEYNRQKRLRQSGAGIYIEHTGWNEYQMAESTYRKLRLKYTEQGEHDKAGKFFFREKSAQRKQKSVLNRVLQFGFNEWLFGYGERIGRVVINSLFIIFGSAIIYYFGNVVSENGTVVSDFGISLYFSIVTFSTLGYGDFHPVGWIRFIAAGEAVIGAFMLALFVVTLTRRLLR